MMQRVVRFFVENYKLTLIMTVFTLVFGAMGLRSMNSETYPAVSLATATIVTSYDGASAEDIEAKITKPVEDEIKSVVGIKDITSVSKSGLSYIAVRVDMDNYDVVEVMDELQKAVERVTDLPADLRERPEFKEINSEELPVYQVAFLGPNDRRQRDSTADNLQEALEDIESVKSVDLKGDAKRQFLVKLDFRKLLNNHIGVSEVMDQISSRNVNIPGGTLKKGPDEALLRVEGKIASATDLENFLIRSNFSGQNIRLKNISTVIDGKEAKRIITSYNGQPATLLTVVKKSGEDTIKLVKEIQERVVDFKKNQVNQDITMVVFNDESETVQDKLDVLGSNALTGLICVIIFLFIFLPGKIGIAASLSLPLAVMGTFGIMPLFDMNLDSITVLALIISIGMLVDNSVVISESYTRFRQEGKSSREAVIQAVGELSGPITASAFTTIAAFLPMLVTKGIMGAFILVIPIIVTSSLLFSLLESFFLLPMRLVFIANNIKPKEEGSGKKVGLMDRFQDQFERLLQFCVAKRYFVAVIFTGVIAVSLLFMLVFNKFILFPAEETEVYYARFEAPNGTTVEATDKLGARLANEIKQKFGDNVVHLIGTSGEQRTDASDAKGGDGANLGLIEIHVSDYMKFNVPYTDVLRDLRSIQPGYLKRVSYEERINGPPVGNAIEGKFRSNDGEALEKMINAVMADMKTIPGVKDLKIDDVIGEDEIFVKINYAKADQVDLHVDDIGNTIRTAISGRIVSEVTLNNKEVDLHVQFDKDFRQDVSDLRNLKIMNSKGQLIDLGSVASFERRRGSPQIKRFKNKRSRTLVGNIDDSQITADQANRSLRQSFEKHREEIKGVTLYLGGLAESTKDSMESLASASVLACIGIFALLVFIFNSFLKPFIIMTTIPMGLLGFSVAFYFHGRPISFLALIGIIGLAGMIVNSGIVLISYIDQLKRETSLSLNSILIKASRVRLRAVLVTSLTTISGLFPTAYGIGGHDAMLIPMTLAMAWGLTTGTILTLVWVPCAYGILEDGSQLVKKILDKFSS